MTITSSKSSHSAVMCYLLDEAEGVEHECAPRREEGGAGEHQKGMGFGANTLCLAAACSASSRVV